MYYVLINVQENFEEHAIRCGQSLVSLTEADLKEIGVAKVGHRLELMEAIEQLRKEGALLSRDKFVDMNSLLTQ